MRALKSSSNKGRIQHLTTPDTYGVKHSNLVCLLTNWVVPVALVGLVEDNRLPDLYSDVRRRARKPRKLVISLGQIKNQPSRVSLTKAEQIRGRTGAWLTVSLAIRLTLVQ